MKWVTRRLLRTCKWCHLSSFSLPNSHRRSMQSSLSSKPYPWYSLSQWILSLFLVFWKRALGVCPLRFALFIFYSVVSVTLDACVPLKWRAFLFYANRLHFLISRYSLIVFGVLLCAFRRWNYETTVIISVMHVIQHE